MERRRP